MKTKIEIEKIVLKIGDTTISLTLDEAKDLQNVLNEKLFKITAVREYIRDVPYHPYHPYHIGGLGNPKLPQSPWNPEVICKSVMWANAQCDDGK